MATLSLRSLPIAAILLINYVAWTATRHHLPFNLLLQDENVGIEDEYSDPLSMAPPPTQQYNWVHEDFSPCSAACGGGIQTRRVTCRSREDLEVVDDGLCDAGLRPPTNQSCGTEACAARWVAEPWGPCSKLCGEGGTRSRQVYCQKLIINQFLSIVADKECLEMLGPKPEFYQKCNENATCPTWFTGPWTPCSVECGKGVQSRRVFCGLFDGVSVVRVDDERCDASDKYDSRPCERKSDKCLAQWYAGPWSECSKDCGGGEQYRRVICFSNGVEVDACSEDNILETMQSCNTIPCDKYSSSGTVSTGFADRESEFTLESGSGSRLGPIDITNESHFMDITKTSDFISMAVTTEEGPDYTYDDEEFLPIKIVPLAKSSKKAKEDTTTKSASTDKSLSTTASSTFSMKSTVSSSDSSTDASIRTDTSATNSDESTTIVERTTTHEGTESNSPSTEVSETSNGCPKPKTCEETRYGCCPDGKTDAKGKKFFGCTDAPENRQGLYIPPTCTDNPFFGNCHVIVQSKFCMHKYYSKYCCRSCMEAGLLSPQDV